MRTGAASKKMAPLSAFRATQISYCRRMRPDASPSARRPIASTGRAQWMKFANATLTWQGLGVTRAFRNTEWRMEPATRSRKHPTGPASIRRTPLPFAPAARQGLNFRRTNLFASSNAQLPTACTEIAQMGKAAYAIMGIRSTMGALTITATSTLLTHAKALASVQVASARALMALNHCKTHATAAIPQQTEGAKITESFVRIDNNHKSILYFLITDFCSSITPINTYDYNKQYITIYSNLISFNTVKNYIFFTKLNLIINNFKSTAFLYCRKQFRISYSMIKYSAHYKSYISLLIKKQYLQLLIRLVRS
uniref:Uncharacterized protein n=1 Tax=Spironucleus salmonicida TaxID=348837 RepID=V6LNP0_9EUKA|eukprot:EST45336.1 Hypothetical protein SS50377_14914 [Spironucleus salmonicida]